MLVRQLKPWHENVGKLLVKFPEVYVRDSGIVHARLNIGTSAGVLGHPVLGSNREGFCIEVHLATVPSDPEQFFYRSSAGLNLIRSFARRMATSGPSKSNVRRHRRSLATCNRRHSGNVSRTRNRSAEKTLWQRRFSPLGACLWCTSLST